jgi:hypothetical protein
MLDSARRLLAHSHTRGTEPRPFDPVPRPLDTRPRPLVLIVDATCPRRAHARSMRWKHRITDAWLSVVCLAVSTPLWLAVVHVLFVPNDAESDGTRRSVISDRAKGLRDRKLDSLERHASHDTEVGLMRSNNPEWDIMCSTFNVLAFANLALHEPRERARYLGLMDGIIDETLEARRAHGAQHFLLPYWRRAPYVASPMRVLFVEGEIAAMLGARLVVEERPELRSRLEEQIARVVDQMREGPVLSGESYPDECWTVDNAFALVAIRLADVVLGQDHAELLARWVAVARERLTDPQTGMLVSEYTWDGRHKDGPEGSSIFLVAHLLQVVDEGFARDQYDRARQALGFEIAGFAIAREWPASWPNVTDIDSGPTIPLVGANAGASGLAVLAAASFDDQRFLRGLLASLDFAAFPIKDERGLRYGASNQVGDAVLLYALVQGPLWDHLSRSTSSQHGSES